METISHDAVAYSSNTKAIWADEAAQQPTKVGTAAGTRSAVPVDSPESTAVLAEAVADHMNEQGLFDKLNNNSTVELRIPLVPVTPDAAADIVVTIGVIARKQASIAPTPINEHLIGVPLDVDKTIEMLCELIVLQLELLIADAKLSSQMSSLVFEKAKLEAQSIRDEGKRAETGAIGSTITAGAFTTVGFLGQGVSLGIEVKLMNTLKAHAPLNAAHEQGMQTHKLGMKQSQNEILHIEETKSKTISKYEAKRQQEIEQVVVKQSLFGSKGKSTIIEERQSCVKELNNISQVKAIREGDQRAVNGIYVQWKTDLADLKSAKLNGTAPANADHQIAVLEKLLEQQAVENVRNHKQGLQTRAEAKQQTIQRLENELNTQPMSAQQRRAKDAELVRTRSDLEAVQEDIKVFDNTSDLSDARINQIQGRLAAMDKKITSFHQESARKVQEFENTHQQKYGVRLQNLDTKIKTHTAEIGRLNTEAQIREAIVTTLRGHANRVSTVAHLIGSMQITANLATAVQQKVAADDRANATLYKSIGNSAEESAQQKMRWAQAALATTNQILELIQSYYRSQNDVRSQIAQRM